MTVNPAGQAHEGTLVPGPWTPRLDAEPDVDVLEPGVDDVFDADPVAVSRFQRALSASAAAPVAPLMLRDPHRAVATTKYISTELARMAAREVVRPWRLLRPLPVIGRGLGRGIAAWWRWAVRVDDVRWDHKARGAQVATRAEIADSRKTRLIITGVVAGTAGTGELVAALMVGDWVCVLTAGAGMVGAWVAGRDKTATRSTVLFGDQAALRPGVPVGMLAKTVVASLGENKVAAEVAALPQETRWGWTVSVITEDEISDKTVRALERKLRARRNSITPVADPDNAAQTALRIVHTDLLAEVGAPPVRKPLSGTIMKAADLGRVMDGNPLILDLLRVHALFVGGTGSGKSSALWTLIDFYTSCRDVIVYGIDLTNGPVFRAWGGCIRHVATTAEDAKDLLERFIRLSKARASRLGERSEPRLGGPPPGDENWDPAEDGPAYVLIIDEYPVLVDARIGGKPARLADLVTTLERIGRKTATTADLAAQRAGKNDLGNTTVRAMTEVQALLPCAAGDVDMLWPGKRAEGWRPDLLKGASGRRANDAGKAFVSASGHDDPRTSRFHRLTLPEIHRRALARMEAGLPEPDEFSAKAWESGEDITDLIVRDVPQILRDMAAGFDAHGVSKLPSAAAVAHLIDTDPEEYTDLSEFVAEGSDGMKRAQEVLARRLAVHGIAPGQLGGPGNPRGYRREHLDRAIAGDLDPL